MLDKVIISSIILFIVLLCITFLTAFYLNGLCIEAFKYNDPNLLFTAFVILLFLIGLVILMSNLIVFIFNKVTFRNVSKKKIFKVK